MATLGMGFSTTQDPDVLAYKQLRAKFLAQEQTRKDTARAARARELQRVNGEQRENQKHGGVLRSSLIGRLRGKTVSVERPVVLAKKLEEDSEFEGEDDNGEVDIKTALKN